MVWSGGRSQDITPMNRRWLLNVRGPYPLTLIAYVRPSDLYIYAVLFEGQDQKTKFSCTPTMAVAS